MGTAAIIGLIGQLIGVVLPVAIKSYQDDQKIDAGEWFQIIFSLISGFIPEKWRVIIERIIFNFGGALTDGEIPNNDVVGMLLAAADNVSAEMAARNNPDGGRGSRGERQ